MQLRGPDRRSRLGGLTAGLAGALVLALVMGPGLACQSSRPSGFYHRLKEGENLYRLGLRYGVPPKEIARANGIRDVSAIASGRRLFIPKRPGARPPVKAKPAASSTAKRKGEVPRGAFRWPVRGRLTSRFGVRNGRPHEGIDLAARKGTPIRAAAPGRVLYSGRLGSYGNVVIVDHPGPYRTVYAHASRLHVGKGERVKQGQRIAAVGSTGRSSGPHLHFEIRRGEKPRDPMVYLR